MPSYLLEEYKRHPERSVNLLLNRKIPIPDRIRSIIVSTHEQADGKGFPQKTPPEKIPSESFLIQFSVLLDQELTIEMGQERKAPEMARKAVFDREFAGKKIPLDLLMKIKSGL
jgi:response regulator RpfG family c-di-GMP phosphodiesterase